MKQSAGLTLDITHDISRHFARIRPTAPSVSHPSSLKKIYQNPCIGTL